MQQPMNMERLVKSLERCYGAVDLVPEDGMTKVVVGGLRLSFPDAEKLALGKLSFDDLKKSSRTAVDGGTVALQ